MELITVENLWKTYRVGGEEVPVLKGVSLTVRRGELVALTGSSGGGKSTLMNTLGCLDRPSGGQYFLGDRALYMAAVKASRPMYSTTGIIPDKGKQNALDMLLQFDPELKDAKVDLAKTFDDRFVKKAAAVKRHFKRVRSMQLPKKLY